MSISPDNILYWQWGWLHLNATLLFTWLIMLLLTLGSYLVTRRLSVDLAPGRWQMLLEILVLGILNQLTAIGLTRPRRYLGFLGSLFLFIALAALLTLVPGFEPPTGSLSTTAALAGCVFIAVPLYGIAENGLRAYLRAYLQPTVIMLPFNILGEFSRTLALAARLFGNMMSGSMILAILLTITPLFLPVIMSALGLLTGMVQAYIFTILAAVYIAAATRSRQGGDPEPSSPS